MKFSFFSICLAFIASLSSASPCNSAVAEDWPYTPDTDCNGEVACESIEAEGQCNALGLVDDEDTTCVQKLKRFKQKRAVDLDCTSSETCYFFVDNSLLCLDTMSGDYHDDVGGSGNAISGVYTAADGAVQTVTGVTAESTRTATATRDGSASATVTGESEDWTETVFVTSQPSASAGSASGSSAAAQQTNGAEDRERPAMMFAAAVPLIAAML